MLGRLENSYARGIVPSSRFTTETARAALSIAKSHYGFTRGGPNSEERRQQCEALLRSNYYAFRCCPSYRQDRDKWSAWFCTLQENKEILPAVRHQAQIENANIEIPDLKPATIYYLLHQCQPPAGVTPNDKTWLFDPILRQQALDERAKMMRRTEKFEAAQKVRKRNYWEKICADTAVEYYIMAPIRTNPTGPRSMLVFLEKVRQDTRKADFGYRQQ